MESGELFNDIPPLTSSMDTLHALLACHEVMAENDISQKVKIEPEDMGIFLDGDTTEASEKQSSSSNSICDTDDQFLQNCEIPLSEVLKMTSVEHIVDKDEEMRNNALQLFNEAMSYKTSARDERNYEICDTWNISSTSKRTSKNTTEPSASNGYRKYNKPTREYKNYPRARYNVDSASFFEIEKKGNRMDQWQKALETERDDVFQTQLQKDVDRLLTSANKIYGYRNWSLAERKEFEKFCRSLRLNGTLSLQERNELKQFYARAYNLIEVKNESGDVDYITESGEPMMATTNKAGRPSKCPKMKKIREYKRAVKPKEEESSASSLYSTKSTYRAFRNQTLELFGTVMSDETIPAKKRGRPLKPRCDQDPMFQQLHEERKLQEEQMKEKNISRLLARANEVHGFMNKVWTQEEKKEFEKFYNLFQNNHNFTLQQSKELNEFYLKAYGQTQLIVKNQEELDKRLFWQEYRRKCYPNKKGKEGTVLSRAQRLVKLAEMQEQRRMELEYLKEVRDSTEMKPAVLSL